MLDERYGEGVSSLSPMFVGSVLPPSAAQCPVPSPLDKGPLFYASRSWSPIARITTWPTNSEQGAWFLGSPGAWLRDPAYSRILQLVPRKGTLGHLLSSPARRIARSLVGLPLDDAKTGIHDSQLQTFERGNPEGKRVRPSIVRKLK